MTGYTTIGYANNFQLQVKTDNPVVFAMIEDYVRRCLDWEQGQQMAKAYVEDSRSRPALEERHGGYCLRAR